MDKRSAIVISGAMVVALLAGMVGANRASIQATTARPQTIMVQRAPTHSTPAVTDRE